MTWFKQVVLPDEMQTREIKTVRRAILKIPGNVVGSRTYRHIRMPAWPRLQEIDQKAGRMGRAATKRHTGLYVTVSTRSRRHGIHMCRKACVFPVGKERDRLAKGAAGAAVQATARIERDTKCQVAPGARLIHRDELSTFRFHVEAF